MIQCTKYNRTAQIQIMNYNFKLVKVPMLHYTGCFLLQSFQKHIDNLGKKLSRSVF